MNLLGIYLLVQKGIVDSSGGARAALWADCITAHRECSQEEYPPVLVVVIGIHCGGYSPYGCAWCGRTPVVYRDV